MAAQPETLKYGPQWIRELPDSAFNPTRHSSRSPTRNRIANMSPVPSIKCLPNNSSSCAEVSSSSFGDKRKDSVGQSFWFGESLCTPVSGIDVDGQGLSSGEPSKQYSNCVPSNSIYSRKCNTNEVINSSGPCDDVNKHTLQWDQKSLIPAPEPCWQLCSTSGDVMLVGKTLDSFHLSTPMHSISSQSVGSSEIPYAATPVFPGNSSVLSNATLNVTSSPLNDGVPVPQSDSFRNNNADSYNQSKRAVSAYYGIKDPDKISDSNMNPSTIWMQQHIWSKSVPQHLHGPNPVDSVSSSISNLCGVATTGSGRHTSSSVPDIDNIHHIFSRLPAFDRIIQSSLSNPYPPSTVKIQNPCNILDEERGFLRPDGSDQPDEHMWLYEDPQGRTQGSFSDAQMNEWLMAGIYFTPYLRIRRKCDDTFSTLASYTQLFERVPFVPGPRIPPIHGGINLTMLALSNTAGSNKLTVESLDNSSINLTSSGNSNSHNHAEVNMINPRIIGANSVDDSRILLSESQRRVYQQLSDFPTSNATTNATGTSVSSCHVTEESLHIMRPKNPLYGLSDISVSVSAPISLLNSSISNLRLGDSTEADFKSILDNSSNLHQQKQPVTSVSNFMNLASLISLNQSFPSFNFQFPSRPQTENGTTMEDLTATASSFLSPGFWSILTQYLNLNPPSSNQTTTPMQQLAETAQLAAQLAALAGSHSPDQTPMQPAQALALAQFLMTRGVGLGNGNTTTSNCSNVGPISSKKDECFDEDCGPNSCSLHTSGTCAISERRQESQTQRPCLGSSANRNPSHGGDGRFNSLNKTSSEIVFAKNCTNMSDSSPNGNQSGHSHRSNNLNKSQPSVSKPSASPRSTKAKSKNQLDSASSEIMSFDQLSSLDGCGRSQQNGRTPTNTGFCSSASARSVEVRQNVNNLSLTGSTNQSKTKVKHPTSGHLERVQLSDARFARFESDSGNSSSSVVIDNASANSQKPLTNSVSKSSNVRSPTKATVLNNPSSAHSAANANIRSSETTFSSVVSNSENDSDQTVEEELKRLTQWCQSRLSSMPMREKVDIPTVVELLATLDAPYEVERMVQTFLGETARTTQFVKDFLDRRRPFWQLHRKRREQACTMQESTCQNPGNQSVNTVRPTEKKKRANPNDCSTSNTQRQNASTCNGLSWTKSDPVHLTNTEQAQDNQWHHIKPKGSHNRKCKKDKST